MVVYYYIIVLQKRNAELNDVKYWVVEGDLNMGFTFELVLYKRKNGFYVKPCEQGWWEN